MGMTKKDWENLNSETYRQSVQAAYLRGEQIEFKDHYSNEYATVTKWTKIDKPLFNWDISTYRVARKK